MQFAGKYAGQGSQMGQDQRAAGMARATANRPEERGERPKRDERGERNERDKQRERGERDERRERLEKKVKELKPKKAVGQKRKEETGSARSARGAERSAASRARKPAN